VWHAQTAFGRGFYGRKLALIGFVWLCFGFVLALFFHSPIAAYFSYSFYIKELTFISAILQIGFVLHKKGRFVENSRQLSNTAALRRRCVCALMSISLKLKTKSFMVLFLP